GRSIHMNQAGISEGDREDQDHSTREVKGRYTCFVRKASSNGASLGLDRRAHGRKLLAYRLLAYPCELNPCGQRLSNPGRREGKAPASTAFLDTSMRSDNIYYVNLGGKAEAPPSRSGAICCFQFVGFSCPPTYP